MLDRRVRYTVTESEAYERGVEHGETIRLMRERGAPESEIKAHGDSVRVSFDLTHSREDFSAFLAGFHSAVTL